MLTEVYRSEAYAADDFNNNFSQKQEAYMTTDISVTYAKDNYEIFAKINNLFNQNNGLWVQDDAIYPINFTTPAIAGFTLQYSEVDEDLSPLRPSKEFTSSRKSGLYLGRFGDAHL